MPHTWRVLLDQRTRAASTTPSAQATGTGPDELSNGHPAQAADDDDDQDEDAAFGTEQGLDSFSLIEY